MYIEVELERWYFDKQGGWAYIHNTYRIDGIKWEASAMTATKNVKCFGIFQDLNENELENISEIAKLETFEKGQRIFQENSIARNLYLVSSGQVEIRMRSSKGASEMAIDTLGPGEMFGWSSLTEPRSFTAAAYSLDKSVVCVINGNVLRDLFKKNNHIGFKVMMKVSSVISQRLRSLNKKVLESK